MPESMPADTALRERLHAMDRCSYPAYKQLRGSWRFGTAALPFVLHIDHVQGDPFAAPSRVRVRVAQADAGFPESSWSPEPRGRALASWLALRFADAIDATAGERCGSGGSGRIDIDRPGQQVLQRTCVRVDAGAVEARFVVGLPADGRRILGNAAVDLLCRRLPDIVAASLRWPPDRADEIDTWTHTVEDAVALRGQLRDRGLVAFVGDGAILPRRSGVDDTPLTAGTVVPFVAPPSLRVTLQAPHAGTISGLGVPAGVTLIIGGGFHGKSTLLAALERGVYDHRPGDGRERVVTDPAAVKVRAEDGRRVAGVDLSPFIGPLPFGRDTVCFDTDNASGSTSQAAAIVEALEAGARALFVDEDTAATNFMIRDGRMRQLVAPEAEPITPFLDRVRQLYEERDVSSVLVMGGSGDYFGVADTVIALQDYAPRDVSAQARAICAADGPGRDGEASGPMAPGTPRVPLADSIDPRRGRRDRHWKVHGTHRLDFGGETVDLSGLSQLVDASQTRAIAAALVHARRHVDGEASLTAILDGVLVDIDRDGLDSLDECPAGDRAAFRRFELAAALNRLRSLSVRLPAEAAA